MNYKLLAVSCDMVNIGDYVQALASSQFYPRIDGFIEREFVHEYNGEPSRVIMNGWYQHNPTHWPPSGNIEPLYVAVHINSTAREKMLCNESIKYFKLHEPIGCRDTATRDMLKEKGVDSYFSGCMTLTLGKKYRSEEKDGKVYFVDPYFVTNWNLKNKIKNAVFLFFHYSKIKKIAAKHPDPKTGLRKMMIITTFFREYRKIFTDETLLNAEYICQQSKHWKEDFPTNEERLKEAERLVKGYAKAALVVTSRIHCALPCLGLETPVIYTENAQQSEASACRFGGIRELFTILKWDKNHLEPEYSITGKISARNNLPVNKNNWKPIADQLISRCSEWIKQDLK